jgi:phosphatidylserine decarboxylase
MAIDSSQPGTSLKAAPIHSVQPGGGVCMEMELAWGRLRRWFLRKYWPNYVKQMAEKRQGDCPNCPHDVIDGRDLKYYRNVCGFWFKDEDDGFRERDHLGLARIGLAEVTYASVIFFLVTIILLYLVSAVHWVFLPLLLADLAFWGLAVAFFRDPERTIPDRGDVLVSPADGSVTHIDEVDEPDFPGGKAFRISIFLSIFNVHVNRVPRSGKVVDLRYYPGAFLDARHPQCGTANEQLWIDLDDTATGRRIRVKQISGKMARRIVCWLKPGEEVKCGDRFGMIKYGSRTEVYLPADMPLAVQVRVGDSVQGGATILLRFKDQVAKLETIPPPTP